MDWYVILLMMLMVLGLTGCEENLILVYCRNGNRSKQASEKLVALGYTNICEFGGINDWTGETVSN